LPPLDVFAALVPALYPEVTFALGVPITDLFEPPASDAIICPKCGAKLEIKAKE
jgi:hypothetical protein